VTRVAKPRERSVQDVHQDTDAERAWIVVGQERQTVTLGDGVDFFGWARKRWPSPRWSVELNPWQLSPTRPEAQRP
jgi:hypothetical protein